MSEVEMTQACRAAWISFVNRLLSVVVLISLSPQLLKADISVPVSSLDLTQMTCGWSVAKANKNVNGGSLRLRGRTYKRGIGTHAPSKLRIDLHGGGDRFKCVAGIDDSATGHGSVQFLVVADSKIIWDSGIMTGDSPALSVDLDIRDVDILELQVVEGVEGKGYDHADWAESLLVMRPKANKPHSVSPYETIELNTKSFALRFAVGDDRRLYQVPVGASKVKIPPPRNDVAYPQGGDGYVFEPAIQVVHSDGDRSTSLVYAKTERQELDADRELVRIYLRDKVFPLEVVLCFRIHRSRDVIEQWMEIIHHESGTITLERMASSSLLFSPEALHLLHYYGGWADEMNPIVEKLTPGMKVLDSKLGVRSNQFTLPSFVISLDGPPQENQGRVLAGSLAWSGSFQAAFDHRGDRIRALCGINPYSSAYHLVAGEMFQTPTMLWVWSNRGVGDMSRKFHRWAREYGLRDGNEPRDTLLNNWEATGFDFDAARIIELFGPAKEIGMELFLLDDGWFGNKHPRLSGNAGLGDWEPNRKRFPNGLTSVAQAAVQQGLRFGIWIEPEMVNPRSRLYEEHPDWVIGQPKRELDFQRSQLILDLTRPEVQEFEWNVIKKTLGVPGISYAKWDANRCITQPGSTYLPANRQTHLWIDYTHGLYDLMSKTADAFPDIDLMLCSGGGGRVDYGALKYFHEFWPSDNTDAVRRLAFQWDYSMFFPAMSICSHVSKAGNRPLHFATAVAMSARFGMDIDTAKMSEEEIAICRSAVDAYKQVRDIVHLGDLYRIETPHDSPRCVVNFVNSQQTRAVAFSYQLQDGSSRNIKVQGLAPNAAYRISELHRPPQRHSLPEQGRIFTGKHLMEIGIQNPGSQALQATIIELTRQK